MASQTIVLPIGARADGDTGSVLMMNGQIVPRFTDFERRHDRCASPPRRGAASAGRVSVAVTAAPVNTISQQR